MASISTESAGSSAAITRAVVGHVHRGKGASLLTLVTAKMLMAVTGAGLIGFVAVHMIGNLQIYVGQEALNTYAKFLKSMPALLWTARIGLVVTFGLHLGLAVYLRKKNKHARPQQYVMRDPIGATLASRTMLSSGFVIFAFSVYHLLHFTLGVTDPTSHHLVDAAGRHDVYSMVVLGFSNIYVSVAYVVAMLFLGLHLSHATSSMLQTLGLTNAASRSLIHRIGLSVAAVLMIGNISIPVGVLLGLIGLPDEVAAR
jgi:succinate dehydrogenase / fumarate reductase cytochrome b subunit